MLTLAVTLTKDYSEEIVDEVLAGNTDLATFRRWLTIEAMMFIVTVVSNIIIIFLRTFAKDPLQLDFDSVINPEIETLDYLRSESTQNLVNMLSICLFPITVFGFLLTEISASRERIDSE